MSMDFRAAAGRVRQLLAPPSAARLATSGLAPDALRDNIIAEAERDSARFRQITGDVPALTHGDDTVTWDGFGECARDIARAAFGWDEPEFVSPEKVKPSARLGLEVARAVARSTGFTAARPFTRNSELESLYTAMELAGDLKDLAQDHLAEHIARAGDMQQAERRQQSAEDMMEQLRQRAHEDVAEHGTVQDDTRRDLKHTLRKLERANVTLGELLDEQANSSIAADATIVGSRVAQRAKDAAEGIGSIPGMGGGNPHNLSADQQIALAEEWRKNQKMMNVVRMLGRMLRSFRFKRLARTTNVNHRPVGIRTGDDLRHVLPSELARAASPNPMVRAMFAVDYQEKALLQRKLDGDAPAGKGPIIVVVDGSGSMRGERFTWATSLALTLLAEAIRTRRAFAGVEFGSHGQLKTWMFPKGQPADPAAVLDYASHFFGGGTSIVTGMNEALRIVTDEPAYSTADVVLIGDGQCSFGPADEACRKALLDRSVRIHGLTILTGANPYFDRMCDWSIDVTELAGANDATDKLAARLS